MAIQGFIQESTQESDPSSCAAHAAKLARARLALAGAFVAAEAVTEGVLSQAAAPMPVPQADSQSSRRARKRVTRRERVKDRIKDVARSVQRALAAADAGADATGSGAKRVSRGAHTVELDAEHSNSAGEDCVGFAGLAHIAPIPPRSAGLQRKMQHDKHQVRIDSAWCDAALGGGLACGALHEICGVCGGAAEKAGRNSNKSWIVPFGCVLHILRGMRVGNAHARRLIEQGVAWIGDRVHPNPEALVDVACAPSSESYELVSDDTLLARSVFVRDTQAHGEAGRTPKVDARMCSRVWCCEQAFRLGVVGVIVVDGTGFDAMAWRRLQLAAGESQHPLVLVLTPPVVDASGHASGHASGDVFGGGGLSRRGCTAQTRWTVHPSVASDAESADDSRRFDCRWSMRLEAIRSCAGAPADAAEFRSRMAEGRLVAPISLSRAPFGTEEWAALRERVVDAREAFAAAPVSWFARSA